MSPPAVLVVSFRRADLLARCLDSVARWLPESAVFCWDNHSDASDDVRALAAARPGVRWTFGATNAGFAAAVNALARQTDAGSDLLLLNPDAELTGDLARTRALLEIPRTAAAAPREADARRPLTLTRALVSESGYLAATRWSDRYRHPPGVVDGYLGGACLLVKRTAWDELGPFDPSFFLYGEEADWQRRARLAGWTLRRADEPGFRHTAEGTVTGASPLQRRSRDLLHEAQAHRLQTERGTHTADVYAAATGVLERVQRSKRVAVPDDGRPSVVLSTNTLDLGGAERLQVQVAGALARRGYDVTLACVQRFGPQVPFVDPAVRLVRRPWWAPFSLPRAGRRAVLLTNETNTEAGLALGWRTGRPDRRWFVAGHTPVAADGPTYGPRLARALRHADGFIALSESHWQALRAGQDVGDRHVVIGNGVPEALPNAPIRDDGPVRLVMVSRITEAKNPQLLVAALAGVRDVDWTLDVWGDGPDRERLAALTPAAVVGRVRWHGWTEDPGAALAAADVLCLPSRAEVFPMIALEAMARGMPVIASGVAALPEILADGAGIVVAPVTVAAWTGSLQAALADRPRLREVGRAAARRFAARYTLAATVDAYAALVDSAFDR